MGKGAAGAAAAGTATTGTASTAAFRRAGAVDVTVSLPTLMGLSDDPGIIPGWGAVTADIARKLTADPYATWQANVYDADGHLIHRGRIGAPPPVGSVAGEYAFVKARDKTCRWPGCRVPARVCDVDHTIQRQHGGPHHRCNQACLCRFHHVGKDEGGFRVVQLGWGVLKWTTPLGHTYTTEPETPPF